MIIFINGPTERKRLEINMHDKLYKKVKEAFDVDTFTLSFDELNNNKIDINKTIEDLNIQRGCTIYMHHEVVKKDIKRGRDKLTCNHNVNVMCANCAPLDPWDAKYFADKKIKYLSFNSYKEMCASQNEELTIEDYTPKVCTDHPKKTRCIKCQEKDVVLNPQRYRMVDHVEFDDYSIVENFIRHWREKRKQFLGFLVGVYKPYDLVPLGMKALVSGIWMPEQENYPDGFVFKDFFNFDFLKGTNLEIVGMIYTDLIYDKQVTSSKLQNDIFLSSLEVDFISKLQFMFPHIEKGKIFNSKFVTIVVTANNVGDIELKEYQVSSQCMALTRNRSILPTDNPKMFYTTKNIFYKILNEDATPTTQKADPFLPVEFFVVRLTHGNKQNPKFCNSEYISESFTNKKMAEYFLEDYSMEKFSNFSLLMQIKNKITDFPSLLKCIVDGDKEYFARFTKSEDFKELVHPLQQYYKRSWTCQACTYINERNLDICEVCETRNIGA